MLYVFHLKCGPTAPSCLFAPQKGFGEEVPGIQRKLEQFFAKFGKVAAVRLRRIDGTKAFKVLYPARIRATSANL
jgi:hypothetical protein